MSAPAIARRKLAEIDARAGKPPPAPDERNEADATNPPAVLDPVTSRVKLVSRVPPSPAPEPAAPPHGTSRVNLVSFVEFAPESAPRSAFAGLSDCLLAALKAQAAAGDAGAARQAVALADYRSTCDRARWCWPKRRVASHPATGTG